MYVEVDEPDGLRLAAYENSKIYIERSKHWPNKQIMKKRFEEGDIVILFNSKLGLFPGKLRSQWLGLFKVNKVSPLGAIEVWSESSGAFKVNR